MKKFATKAWRGLLAAVTSPTAVKQEKSLGVFIAVRVIQSVGGSAALIELLTRLSH